MINTTLNEFLLENLYYSIITHGLFINLNAQFIVTASFTIIYDYQCLRGGIMEWEGPKYYGNNNIKPQFEVSRDDIYFHPSGTAKSKDEMKCTVNGDWFDT